MYFFSLFATTFCPTKSVRKTAFFLAFSHDVPQKVLRKQCFFAKKTKMFFKAALYKVCKKCFLHDVPQKVGENSVFSCFLRHFVAFCTTSHKKCEKTVFFTFFEAIHTKLAKNAKKQRFSNFLRDVPQKVCENNVLSRSSRHFVQCSQ